MASLKQAFEDAGFEIDDATVHKAELLCVREDVSSADLAERWEVFSFNKKKGDVVTEKDFKEFDAWITPKLAKERMNKVNTYVYTKPELDDMDMSHFRQPERSPTNVMVTIGNGKRVEPSTTPVPKAGPAGVQGAEISPQAKTVAAESSSFSNRQRSGEVVAILNEAKSEVSRNTDEDVPMALIGDSLENGVRFMTDRLEDKAAYLEKRILAFADEFEKNMGTNCQAAVDSATQEPVWAVGRVVVDGETEGRLNLRSVLLEGSIKHSMGRRVKLNLDGVASASLFPGQVVAVHGVNPTGYCFVVQKIVDAALPEMPSTPIVESDGDIDMVVAAGPFTTSEDLSYQPLDALLAYVGRTTPSVLILLGPFVDVEHAGVRTGNLEVSFAQLFESLCEKLRALDDISPNTKLCLAPSIRDVHHDPVFPQAPFPPSSLAKSGKTCTSLPNPATFTVGTLTMTTMSHDILMRLSAEEVSHEPAVKDRMARLAAHCIGQRSAYPLFPPARGSFFDCRLADAAALPQVPHLMLTVSDLTPFAKTLEIRKTETDTLKPVAVNPGRLCRGAAGGTFAHINLKENLMHTSEGSAEQAVDEFNARTGEIGVKVLRI